MEIKSQIKIEDVLIAQLAVNYTFLAMAPHDSWGHAGSPAEMAAYVVETARKEGKLGFLINTVLGSGRFGPNRNDYKH